MPTLVAIRGPSAGKHYPITGSCVLGRSFNSDVYIGDLNVSRRHAQISQAADGHFVIEDLGSGNGTFVNDQLVTRHRLASRDVLRIGGSAFRFDSDPQPRWVPDVLTAMAELGEPESGEQRLAAEATVQLKAAAAREAQGLDALRQDRAVGMLKAMYAVADVIADELDLPRLLDKVLGHLFGVFPQADRAFVLLVNRQTGQLVPEAVRQRSGTVGGEVSFSQTIVDQVLRRGAGVIGGTLPPTASAAARASARAGAAGDSVAATQGSHGAPKMGAPLICRGDALGTIHLEGRSGSLPFSPEDLTLLSAIARQAALAIANARAGQSLLSQQRLEADLQLARRIQEGFLPRQLPRVPGLEFDTHYAAAQHVGGDFYDVIELRPALIGILVGDVSGKGVSAALLMAKLTTAIRLHAQTNPQPSAVLDHANSILIAAEQDAMFATVLFILLDLEARTFSVANAGHQPPIVCSHRFSGVSELDDAMAVALGVVPEMHYPQEIYQLVPGDVVLLYTDGINEALNREGKDYGMMRLRKAITGGRAEPAEVVRRVVADVQRFVRGAPQSDDQTLVAFGLKVGERSARTLVSGAAAWDPPRSDQGRS
ncbi:MAG: SpoIIE family protein phosphatase [Proteobacteria bacterium]|nr:SpoIIE family protein phosphatase [Pseudomonadota bacterium]